MFLMRKSTNQTLRERFAIEPQNSAVASRIIKDALLACAIKEDDPESNSKKYKIYSIGHRILTPIF